MVYIMQQFGCMYILPLQTLGPLTEHAFNSKKVFILVVFCVILSDNYKRIIFLLASKALDRAFIGTEGLYGVNGLFNFVNGRK